MKRIRLRTSLLVIAAIALVFAIVMPSLRYRYGYQGRVIFHSGLGKPSKTQARLLLSERSLTPILSIPAVAALPAFQGETDPVRALGKRVDFRVIEGTRLIEWVVDTESEPEAKAITEAIASHWQPPGGSRVSLFIGPKIRAPEFEKVLWRLGGALVVLALLITGVRFGGAHRPGETTPTRP